MVGRPLARRESRSRELARRSRPSSSSSSARVAMIAAIARPVGVAVSTPSRPRTPEADPSRKVGGGGSTCACGRREWSTEDLIASWRLVGDDWQLVGNKTGRDATSCATAPPWASGNPRWPRNSASAVKPSTHTCGPTESAPTTTLRLGSASGVQGQIKKIRKEMASNPIDRVWSIRNAPPSLFLPN